ncbi:hypothetical protein Golax_015024, partial [Gossypium laxum]|nr:hypothetical protein [Gossypium laxum]
VANHKIYISIRCKTLNIVSDLVNQRRRIWREDIIANQFSSEKATLILCIPLSRYPHNDRQVWRVGFHVAQEAAQGADQVAQAMQIAAGAH